jgi:protein associated with RNAse G/E
MTKLKLWNKGDNIILRGIYESRPVYAQSMRVVKDAPNETALLLLPGAECMAPGGYIHHGHNGKWNRWTETIRNTLHLEKFHWHTNRFLVLLEPEKFYSIMYIWEAATGQFVCYYVNFQLPLSRTPQGFDTLDLDLDIVVEASHRWKWKDETEYQTGIRAGGIRPEWVRGVERAQKEVLSRIEANIYPLDGSWLNWQPDPTLLTSYLPENWNEVV